jgi:hypothetical protein
VTPARLSILLLLRLSDLRDQTKGESVSVETRHTGGASAGMWSLTLPSRHCMAGVTRTSRVPATSRQPR